MRSTYLIALIAVSFVSIPASIAEPNANLADAGSIATAPVRQQLGSASVTVPPLMRWSLEKARILAIPKFTSEDATLKAVISTSQCTISSAMGTPRKGLCSMNPHDATETPMILALSPRTYSDVQQVVESLRASGCFASVRVNEAFISSSALSQN